MISGTQHFAHSLSRPDSVALALMIKAVRLLRGETGGALVEMALCIPLLGAPILIGTVESGMMLYDSIELSNAAHAGTAYGMMSSTFAANSSGMTAAAQAEAGDLGSLLNVTPTTYFACSQAIPGTQYTTQSAANSACTGASNHALQFVQVITTAAVPVPFRVPGLPNTFNLTATSVMEVEE